MSLLKFKAPQEHLADVYSTGEGKLWLITILHGGRYCRYWYEGDINDIRNKPELVSIEQLHEIDPLLEKYL